jgi:hypothetical protein
MFPSLKRLEIAFPGKGSILRKLLTSDATVNTHPAAIAREKECYHPPGLLDKRLHALNAECEGFGVEYITHKQDGYTRPEMKGIEYINLGDTYATTILYDHGRDSWRLTDWGSIVESRRCYE